MSVEINATNFPNAAFRQYVSSTFDTNSDGILSDSEIQSVVDIRLNHNAYPTITSVKGIEFFTNLQILHLYDYPAIDYIDLSVYPNLEEFRCDYCGFLTLDFSSNNSITTIYCQRCTEITSIILGNKASLKKIKASFNTALNTIDVSGCVNLEVLELSYANLTSINVSSCTKLYSLVLYHVNLSTLDITNCPILVDCYRNVTITRFTSNDTVQKYYRRANAERDDGYEGFGTLLITTIVDGQGPSPTNPLDLRMYLTNNKDEIVTTGSESTIDADTGQKWVTETKSVCKHMHPQSGSGRYLCIKVRLENPKIIGALKSFDFSLPVFFEVSSPSVTFHPYKLSPDDNGNRQIACYVSNAAWTDETYAAITQFSMGSASCSKVITNILQHNTWTNRNEIIEDLSKLTIFDFHFNNIHKNSWYFGNDDLYIWVCTNFKDWSGYNDDDWSYEPVIATLLSERVSLPTTSTREEVEENYGTICGTYTGGAQSQRYWYYIPKEYSIRNVQLYDMELQIFAADTGKPATQIRIAGTVRLTLNHTIPEYVTFTFSDGDDIIYMNGISAGSYSTTVEYTCSRDWYRDITTPIGKRKITVTASSDSGRVAVSSFDLLIDELIVTGTTVIGSSGDIFEDETYTLHFFNRQNCKLTVQFFYNDIIIKELIVNTDQIEYSLSRSDLNLDLITKYVYPITIKCFDEYNRIYTLRRYLNIYPQLLEQPADTIVREGEQASFSITLPSTTDDGGFHCQWEESIDNGVSWTKLNSWYPTLTFTATASQNKNKYRCRYYLDFSSLDYNYSDSATLTVIKPPVIVRNLQNVYAPENTSTELQLEIEDSVGMTYQWQYKDVRNLEWTNINESPVPMEDATIISYEIENVTSDLEGRLYRCILSNPVGSVISNEVSVNIITAPVILQQPISISVVEGTIAHFLVEIANQPTLTHTYLWQVKPPGGEWSDGVASDEDLHEEYLILADMALSGYQYRCIVTNDLGTITSDPATLTVTPDSRSSSPAILNLTEGQSGNLEISTTDHDEAYQWQASSDGGATWTDLRSATNPTYNVLATLAIDGYQYRCIVTIPTRVIESEPSILTVTPDISIAPPVIRTQPSSITVAEGSSATFAVEARGQDISYQWQVFKSNQWTNIQNATSASYIIVGTRSADGNRYRCVISNAAGAVYSDPVTLTVTIGVYVSTPRVLTQPRSVNVELGELVTFWIRADGGDLSYQWQKLNNNTWYDITGATSPSYSLMARTEVHNTQYRCVVTNTAGSVTSNTATLSIRAGHDLSFYGYHSIIISGKNTYGEWEMYPTSRPHVAPPEVKTSYVDLPGADGGLDYTDLLTGEPRYGYRKGSWEFLLIPQDRWAAVYRSLVNFLHGRQHTVILEDDPNYVYTGRLSVNEWQSAAHNSLITIDYILEPFPRNISGQEEDEEENQILSMASTLLNKEKYAGMVIGKLNGAATLIYPDMLFDDGDNIAY